MTLASVPLLRPVRELRILLAEDDADVRAILQGFLAPLGHVVLGVGDGVRALGQVGKSSWDLVLVDDRMPGASGIDVLARAFAVQPAARRVLMSTILHPDARTEARMRGHADAVIEKPLGRMAFELARSAILGRGALTPFEVRVAEA